MNAAVNPSTAMARVLVDELARVGVRHVVVAPGSRSTALAIAVARHASLTVHVRHDERSAAFVALGIGRATGTPAVVVTTSGTAVANLAPAVVEADAAGVPLVLLTADRPVELHDVGANQSIRQDDLFAGRVRWRVHLPAASGHEGEPALWRSSVDLAVAAATGTGHTAAGGPRGGGPRGDGAGIAPAPAAGTGGPVHLDVAFREPTVPGLDDGRRTVTAYDQPTDGRADDRAWTTVHRVGARPEVTSLAARLAGRRVLVVAGDVARPLTGLGELAARGWPVVAEPTAGTRHGVGLAHGSLLVGSTAWLGTVRPDVVLRLGRPTLARAVHGPLADVPTVQVTASGIVDPARAATDAVVADPAAVLDGLLAAGPGPPPPGWAAAWTSAAEAAAGVVADHLDVPAPAGTTHGEDPAATATGPAVARRVAAATGDRPLVVASSLPIRDLDAYGHGTGGRVLANRGVSGIDGFTSTAVGVALAGGPTVALAGDLSFLHDHNGLLVDDPAAVPLTLVVADNDGGGLFHHVPAVRVAEFERLFATPHGRDLVAVARAAGVTADAVAVDDLDDALAPDSAERHDGLRVLVVRTDRHADAAVRAAIAADLATRLADDR